MFIEGLKADGADESWSVDCVSVSIGSFMDRGFKGGWDRLDAESGGQSFGGLD